jgi:hypothetical protein
MTQYIRLKAFFTEAMSDVMNAQEIAAFAMQEAMKLGKGAQTSARLGLLPPQLATMPPPAKASFTLNTAATHVPANIIKLLKT